MAFNEEQLLNVLAYDSEDVKILTFQQRCLIHKERARQIAYKLPPRDFVSEDLQTIVIKTCVLLRQTGWENPQAYYFDDNGIIKKSYKNK